METEEILAAIQKAADTIATPNCAAWMSALAAFVAVAVAIAVALKQNMIAKKQNEIAEKQADISEKQNRIALFKERYLVYCEFQKIFLLFEEMNDPKFSYEEIRNRKLVLDIIKTIYEIDFELEAECKHIPYKVLVSVLAQYNKTQYQIKQVKFLFSDIKERDVDELLDVWLDYISALADEAIAMDEIAKKFIEKCDSFKSEYGTIMEEQMNLRQG